MRQAQDPVFRDLLGRARAGTLTQSDLSLLNQKVATSLIAPELKDATTIVKLNVLRHHINRIRMEYFAQSRSQRIYIFPAQHSRVSSSLKIEDITPRCYKAWSHVQQLRVGNVIGGFQVTCTNRVPRT